MMTIFDFSYYHYEMTNPTRRSLHFVHGKRIMVEKNNYPITHVRVGCTFSEDESADIECRLDYRITSVVLFTSP